MKTSKSAFEIPLITSNDRTGFLRYPPTKLKEENSILFFLYYIIIRKNAEIIKRRNPSRDMVVIH